MIVITAPTSQIGSRLLPRLLDQKEPVRVVARHPESLPAEVRARVEVVAGSHRDAATIDAALEGAGSLFWLMPSERSAASVYDTYVTDSIPGAEAVHRQGVERVVIVSALGRGSGRYAGNVSASLAMEDLFRSTGTHVRALACPGFMDNVLRDLPSIQEGAVTGTLPADLKLPLIATADIAAAAAPLLLDHSWYGQDTVPLLGGEDLSMNDVAAVLTDVLGRPIRYRRGEREAQKQALLQHGFSEAMAQALDDMMVAKEQGIDTLIPRSRSNTTPTTFRRWVETTLRPALAAREAA